MENQGKAVATLIGMVHLQGLPGTPKGGEGADRIAIQAVRDACVMRDAGFDGVIIENMHDAPYVHGVQGPEVVATMTRCALAVREATKGMFLGIQVLSGGNREAVAIAQAVGAQFVRVENFVFAHVADEGILERAEAGPLLRYRKSIGAEHVEVYADVKKKHASHAITADISLGGAVEAADFFGADGVVVTGPATGKPADPQDVAEARVATDLPVIVGSGVTPQNVATLLKHADALIVGSYLKQDGLWSKPVDAGRCAEIVRAVRAVRG